MFSPTLRSERIYVVVETTLLVIRNEPAAIHTVMQLTTSVTGKREYFAELGDEAWDQLSGRRRVC